MRDWNLGSQSIVRRTHPYVEHARAQAERARCEAMDLNLVFGVPSDKIIAQKRVAGRNSDIEAALIDLGGSEVDGSEASLGTVELIEAQLKLDLSVVSPEDDTGGGE